MDTDQEYEEAVKAEEDHLQAEGFRERDVEELEAGWTVAFVSTMFGARLGDIQTARVLAIHEPNANHGPETYEVVLDSPLDLTVEADGFDPVWAKEVG